VNANELVFVAEDEASPYWPCGHFLVRGSDEIVATLFWDHRASGGGYAMYGDGVVRSLTGPAVR